MELCTSRFTSTLADQRPLNSKHAYNSQWIRSSLPFKRTSISRYNLGLFYYENSSLKSTTSEETSSVTSQYIKDESDGATTLGNTEPTERIGYAKYEQNESSNEDTPVDGQNQLAEFLEKLDIKLESDDTSSVLLIGGGALVTLWLATAVVGAVDSIPLFPKLLEVVGLGYSVWFGIRYLIFKKNRDELAAKIEEIKQQVLGSKYD